MNTNHLPEIRLGAWRAAQNGAVIPVVSQHFVRRFGDKSPVAATRFRIAFQRMLDHLVGMPVFKKNGYQRLRYRTHQQRM